jgi:hypothetical protein
MMFHLLTIVLVVLQATGYINWGWWLVFTPSIIALTVTGIVLVLAFLATMKTY